MKRKALTITICFLALVSIVSIGFASWVITKPIEEQTETGSITAEAVKVDGYTLGVVWQDVEEDETPVIHFGQPSATLESPDGVTPWLSSVDDDESEFGQSKTESLTCTLRVTVSNTANIASGLTLTLNTVVSGALKELTDEDTAFGQAIAANYIAMPTVKVGGNDAAPYNPSAKVAIAQGDFTADSVGAASGYCDVVITFAWGSVFGSINPLNHYNQANYTDEKANEAQTALEAILAIAQEGTSYKVTVGKTA